jgi:hypothetical protein
VDRYIKVGSSEAAQDIREYFGKKIEQADQRIFMLAEEKDVEKAAHKNGIDVSDGMDIDVKIAELKKFKNGIQDELKN